MKKEKDSRQTVAVKIEKVRQKTQDIKEGMDIRAVEKDVQTKATKSFYVLGSLLGIGFLFIGIIIFWSVYPYNVLEIKEQPVKVETKTVKAGEVIVLNYNYCKHTNTKGQLTLFLISPVQKYTLNTTVESTSINCNTALRAPTFIPINTAPGMYHIKHVVTYEVNPLKTTTMEFDTEQFKVLPANQE